MDTKKLRQKILDLAIRGKLVPQDPNDEPASVLLERIRAEKQQLIKEGKIKAPKGSKACDTSHYEKVEGPFEIPESWEWVRLDELCSIKGGKRVPKGMELLDTPTKHIYIRVTNMKHNTIVNNGFKYIDDTVFEAIRRYTINSEDLYLTIAGTIGDVGEVPDVFDGMNLTENAAKLTDIMCDKQYLMYALLSAHAQEHFSMKFHQVAQPKLSIETASSTLITLPPINEQRKIVEELKRQFQCIDIIDSEAASVSNNIDKVKAKILELAISGKLVSQNPTDEPALELLKRINPDFKSCDNSHYENLPNGWVCAMGKDIITLLSGRDLPPSKFNAEQRGIPYLIGASNININKIHITRWTDYPEVISSQNDVLISCKGTVGEIVINNIGEIHIARQFMALRTAVIIPEYLNLLMQSKVSLLKESAKGVIPGISREDILNLKIAIPPIAEQLRIVESVGTLMGLVNKILY